MELEQRYGWRAQVLPNFQVDGVSIMLGRRTSSGLFVMNADAYKLTLVEESTTPDVGPTLTLQDDAGRALLDALAEHYGGVSSLRALRRDYDHERDRVDRLIDALVMTTNRPRGEV